MAWKIKVTYKTGSSFGSEECEDTINLAWNNIDLAKACLRDIKEHYKYYEELDESLSFRRSRENSVIMAEARQKEWCRDIPRDKYDLELSALCDGGEWRTVSTSMWCGYFEALYSAEIIGDEDSDMSFNLR